jgi:MoaA/NifB/PqqE/SkfB family radical SAM enzyme
MWKADWINREEAKKVLKHLANSFNKGYTFDSSNVGINMGLHLTGGEPFLNYDLLLDLTKTASNLRISFIFVETNCFWCTDNEITKERLKQLREAGLHGIMISVNPFILEYVPFKRTIRAIRFSCEVFGRNTMVYQEFYLRQFLSLGIKDTLSFKKYLKKAGFNYLSHVELIPMGRACYELGNVYNKYPADKFFNLSCREELTRPWHIHVDNYYNYMTGYCGGISLGDARHLDGIYRGIELSNHPIIAKLISHKGIENLYKLGVEEYNYRELYDGYISKCHLCLDIRRHITKLTDEYKELKPRRFYQIIS